MFDSFSQTDTTGWCAMWVVSEQYWFVFMKQRLNVLDN